MKKQAIFGIAFALALLAIPCVVQAGPFSLGLRGVNFSPDHGDSDWGGGIKARLNLPLFFAVEASIDHREKDMGGHEVEDWPLQLTAIVHVLPKIIGFQPFLLAGGGWYNSKVESDGGFDDTQSRFAPHAGAGVDFNLNEKWYLDASYRYVWLDDFESSDPLDFGEEFNDQFHMIALGVNYRF